MSSWRGKEKKETKTHFQRGVFLFGNPTNYYSAEWGLPLLKRGDPLLSLWNTVTFLIDLTSYDLIWTELKQWIS